MLPSARHLATRPRQLQVMSQQTLTLNWLFQVPNRQPVPFVTSLPAPSKVIPVSSETRTTSPAMASSPRRRSRDDSKEVSVFTVATAITLPRIAPRRSSRQRLAQLLRPTLRLAILPLPLPLFLVLAPATLSATSLMSQEKNRQHGC